MTQRGTLPSAVARHLLYQLSDLHLVSEGRHRSGADPLENLERAIELMTAAPSLPEGIILTGDLADSGEPGAYRLLRAGMDRLSVALGAPVVYVPGNHDLRSAFREILLGATGGETTTPIDQVHHFGGLRLISLDSVVPGVDGGELRNEQLEWLRAELGSPAPDGTIVALHHPPISSPIRSMAALALADPDRLGAVVQGSDVRLMIAGHNHHATSGLLAGIPVWAAPSLCYRSHPLVEDAYVPLPGSAFTRIDLVDGRPLVTVVPVPL